MSPLARDLTVTAEGPPLDEKSAMSVLALAFLAGSFPSVRVRGGVGVGGG